MSTPLPHDAAPIASNRFPFYSFSGSHREIGEQHGEALRGWIGTHLELIYARGRRKAGLDGAGTRRLAESYALRP